MAVVAPADGAVTTTAWPAAPTSARRGPTGAVAAAAVVGAVDGLLVAVPAGARVAGTEEALRAAAAVVEVPIVLVGADSGRGVAVVEVAGAACGGDEPPQLTAARARRATAAPRRTDRTKVL